VKLHDFQLIGAGFQQNISLRHSCSMCGDAARMSNRDRDAASECFPFRRSGATAFAPPPINKNRNHAVFI
ncbi:MAG: hypothetical protein LUG19_08605, partial [Desulfovibrio sp.]|uniref:hypothetical protein n=1 Tax=Desulfovibrio sp. TaxID=885 RepID=UPI00258484AF